MPPAPRIPAELFPAPFALQRALEVGLTKRQLRGAAWRRVGPAVYARREGAEAILVRLRAAAIRLPELSAFSGPTAAFLHELDSRCEVVEATIPSPTPISRRVGLKLRRRRLVPSEVVLRQGFRVTSIVRTIRDLASRLDLVETVVLIDGALHRKLIRLSDIEGLPAGEYAEPLAESPMETRLRLALVLAGLPKPQVQVPLPDVQARADLYYPDRRLVIEYDGATHRDSLGADNRRQNRLVHAGYRVLRFTAPDVGPIAVASVRRALTA